MWKRSKAPAFYPIPRKRYKWTVKPRPGPHPASRSLPVAIILREILGVARNIREVKYILNQGHFKIDGEVVRDYRYPVGLMDIVSLIPTKRCYRMLPTPKRVVYPTSIKEGEEVIKPCQVTGKRTVRGGLIQLSLHDGRTALIKEEEMASIVKPGGTLVLNLEENEVSDYMPMEQGFVALMTGGKRRGLVGTIQDIRHPRKLGPKVVSVELKDGSEIETIQSYIFPIGREEPVISLQAMEEEQ
jgi:small subunit ribosomal protein S4e